MKYINLEFGRKTPNLSAGFTVVELLITLFIAAAFLLSGFQLYAVIIKDGGETRAQARASNVVNDYLQRYKSSTANPCTVQTPLTNQSLTVSGLSSVTITVIISCPYGSSSVSKVLVTLQYNNPQRTVSNATYTKPQDIVNNGLVLNLDAGDTNSIRGRKSIINWDSWTVSAGGVSGYGVNGDGNSRVMDTNPWGASDVVWDVSNQDVASDADGGWDGSYFPIDNTKMYRFTTFVRRKTIGNGSFYLGTHGSPSPVLNRSNAAANGNPYFSATGWWGNVNQWYLVVGYVWPAGSGAGTAMPQSGIYALDGAKITSNGDYIWQSTTTSSNHRSYLYYSTDTATNQQWYQPRVDVVDGTEPTVNELINNAGNTWYDLSGNGNNGTINRGASYVVNNGGALNFDGISGTISVSDNNSLDFGTGDFSVGFWCFRTVSGYQGGSYIIKGAYTTPGFDTFDSDFRVDTTTGNLATVGLNATYNVWQYHVLVVNQTASPYIKHYINGVLDQAGYVEGGNKGTINNPNALIVGKSTAGGVSRYYNGFMGNIQIYARSLNPAEINQNFNALRGRYGV